MNPYGVAVVPRSIGKEVGGNVLVSNFNDCPTCGPGGTTGNLQGTGTTIVQVSPGGSVTLFAQIPPSVTCPGGVGLTTALVVLSGGWVVVGSLPTTDGSSATMRAGCLIVLNSKGNVVETFAEFVTHGSWRFPTNAA